MMKTVGSTLKEARVAKQLSLCDIEEATKIKVDFIVAIEEGDWVKLPDYPVVVGFVKSIADFLGIDKNKAAAFLRRDYPPKVLSINPKPDAVKRFRWSPKLTFIIGISLVLIGVLTYLAIQYFNFVRPPKLTVTTPQENQTVTSNELQVTGITDPDTTVWANNQPALTDDQGNFVTELSVSTETKEVIIKAKTRSNKETTVVRQITVKLE
jgi:cytoskeletal protein RodZ